MSSGVAALRRQIAQHNRNCLLGALGALFFAWLAWMFFYAIVVGAALLFLTILHGEGVAFPWWLHPAAGALAICLLVWGALDARARRFRPPPDRPVVGWHLLPDVLLLPPRLTFAISETLGSRLRLGAHERDIAWQLLEFVADAGRIAPHMMGGQFTDHAALRRAREALEVLGWIDLHAGSEEWFYRVRSGREAELATLRGMPPPPTEVDTDGEGRPPAASGSC